MRKTIISFIGLILILPLTFFLFSCEDKECEHIWENETVIAAATCTSEGKIQYTCGKCNETKTVSTDKTEHLKSTDYKNDAEGHYFYCTSCGEELDRQAHLMEDDETLKEPTAYEPGIMQTKCGVCGYISEREIEAVPHVMGTELKFNEEYHWYLCTAHVDCPVMMQKEFHTLAEGEVIQEPTNDEDGIRRVYCTVCEYEGETAIPALNHIKGSMKYDDTNHWYECGTHEDCMVVFEKAEHSFAEIEAVPATCTEAGSTTYQCSVCGKTKTVEAPALNHDLVYAEAKAPTCTETGWNAYEACSRCDYTTKEEIEALGHEFVLVNTDAEGHYSECSVCHERDEVIAHTFTEWCLTQEATLYSNGIETKACECGYVSTETRELPAQADFKTDFSTEESDGIWKYGSIVYAWGENETFDFTPFTEKTLAEDGWTAENIEVKAGWINAGNMTAIAYTVSQDIAVKARVCFTGGTEATRLALRVGVKNEAGTLYSNPSFYGMDSNGLDLTLGFDLKAGDTIYFIFSNEAGDVEGAYPSGELTLTLQKAQDFKSEFSTEDSDGIWKYGSIVYAWGENETFDFTPFTEKTLAEDGWTAENIEVKAGWINAGNMTAIAYTVSQDIAVKARVCFTGGTEATRLALRVGVKNEAGTLYSNPSFYGMDSNGLDLTLGFDLKAGDTIYFIFSNEAGDVEGAYPSGELNIVIY